MQEHIYYEIIVESHIDKKRLKDFEGMGFLHLPEGKTLIHGKLPDQESLFGIIDKIRDMNLTLISVKKEDQKMEISNKRKELQA